MAVLLYLFLGWGFIAIWRDLSLRGPLLESDEAPIVILKPLPEGRSPSQTFSGREIHIGRGAQNDLVIENDSVSMVHARAFFLHKQWWLEDLSSTNGTAINGQKIQRSTVLLPGDQIGFGEAAFEIRIRPK